MHSQDVWLNGQNINVGVEKMMLLGQLKPTSHYLSFSLYFKPHS